ncbi:MAG: hypothetical protein HY902_13950 [Deltaproteobacteria bacterium]|nr:hypothetical protein [Deltaproteobacteria bacterium]
MTLTHLRHHQLRRVHMRLLTRAVEFAQENLEQPEVVAAASRFFAQRLHSVRDLEARLLDDDADVQFYPWLLWDADLGEGPLGEGPLGLRLPMRGRSTMEHEVWTALLATRPAAWLLRASEGKSAELLHLGDGRRAPIVEPMLEHGPPAGEVLVARVVDLGDLYLLDAVHAALPGRTQAAMARAQKLAARETAERQLRRLLSAATAAAHSEKPRRGGTLPHTGVRTTLVLQHASEAACLEALHAACARGTLDQLGPRRFAFAGGSLAPAGAVLRLHAERLHASTIHRDRVADLQSAVSELLPEAVLTMTMHRDLAGLLHGGGPTAVSRGELRALANDWLNEALVDFGDTPHADLGGQTPRALSQTTEGIAKMRAWFRAVAPLAALADTRYQQQLASLIGDFAAG